MFAKKRYTLIPLYRSRRHFQTKRSRRACYDRGEPIFFLDVPLNFGSFRPHPKHQFGQEEKKNATAGENSEGLGTQRESCKKK